MILQLYCQLCAQTSVCGCNCLPENKSKTLARAYVKKVDCDLTPVSIKLSVTSTLFVSVFPCIAQTQTQMHITHLKHSVRIYGHSHACQRWSLWTLSQSCHTDQVRLVYSDTAYIYSIPICLPSGVSDLCIYYISKHPEVSILKMCRTPCAFWGHNPAAIFLNNLFLWLTYL